MNLSFIDKVNITLISIYIHRVLYRRRDNRKR